jgi:hypothetical protein
MGSLTARERRRHGDVKPASANSPRHPEFRHVALSPLPQRVLTNSMKPPAQSSRPLHVARSPPVVARQGGVGAVVPLGRSFAQELAAMRWHERDCPARPAARDTTPDRPAALQRASTSAASGAPGQASRSRER